MPAPDPGGHERAIVKVPPPGKRLLGVHEPTIVGDDSPHGWKPKGIARLAAAVGAETMRFTVDWHFVEPSQDSWDEGEWARYEAAYDALVGQGIRPFITVSTAPAWARDLGAPTLCVGVRGCEYPPRPEMYPEWREFVREVARRFPRAAAIEIWNEPNLTYFWKPGPEPERYAELVDQAYEPIKSENPGIQVVGGALAGAEVSERDDLGLDVKLSVRDFLERAYPAGLAGNMDGLSVHQASQAIRYGAGSQLAKVLHPARRARKLYDTRRTPIWISEFGLSTTEGSRVTPSVQADAMLRAYRRVITMRDVRGFIIHTLGDRVELPRSHEERGVGMIASYEPFNPKPSFCAFAGRLPGDPYGGCPKVRESRVSRCTRSLAQLRQAIMAAAGARKDRLQRRHARLTRRCVPCAAPSAASSPRCSRCLRRLASLQKRYARAIETLRLDILNRHERIRKRCA